MNEQLSELMKLLEQRTVAHRQVWEDLGNGVFRTKVDGGYLRISREEYGYDVSLLDASGRLVDEFEVNHRVEGSPWEAANRLYTVLRDNVSDARKLLDSMVSSLRQNAIR